MSDQERMLEKVRKLLAMAESTNHAAEADAFTAKAQQLITEWAIDEAMLAASRDSQDATQVERSTIVIDYSPYQGPKETLLNLVAEANNVRCIFSAERDYNRRTSSGAPQRVSVAHLIGFASDLRSVEVLYTSLLLQAERAFQAPGVQQRMAIETRHPGHRIRWRNAFTLGFASGVQTRLRDARKTAEANAEVRTPGTGLVLADRSSLVESKVKELFPRLVKNQMGAGQGGGSGNAHGHAAGSKADLNQTKVGGSKGALN